MIKEWAEEPLMLDLMRKFARQTIPMIDIPLAARNAQIGILDEEGRVQERAKLLHPFT
jgi:hypothetical protein